MSVSGITLIKSNPIGRQGLLELHFTSTPKGSAKRIERFLNNVQIKVAFDKNQIIAEPQRKYAGLKWEKDGFSLGRLTANPSKDRIYKITIVPGQNEQNYSGNLIIKLEYIGGRQLGHFIFSQIAFKAEAKCLNSFVVNMVD